MDLSDGDQWGHIRKSVFSIYEYDQLRLKWWFMSIINRKMKGLVMILMRQNEVDTWEITKNGGKVCGKQ